MNFISSLLYHRLGAALWLLFNTKLRVSTASFSAAGKSVKFDGSDVILTKAESKRCRNTTNAEAVSGSQRNTNQSSIDKIDICRGSVRFRSAGAK